MPSMSFAVNYVYKREFDLIEDVETTRAFLPRTAHHPGDMELDEAGNVVDTVGRQTFTIYDPDFSTPSRLVITNPDQAEREYRGLELILNKRFSDRWQMQTSFVVSESKGIVGTSFFGSSAVTSLFDNPNALINADGRLDSNRTYALKTLGTYQLPYDIHVSGLWLSLSGLPYTRTAFFNSYDSDGDGINDTLLDAGFVTINAEPRGARTLDTVHNLDLGVEKILDLSGARLGLRWDVYNLFNVDTVLSKRSRTTSAGNFGDPLAFIGARGMRLSARFTF